jgi:hypothetical protein
LSPKPRVTAVESKRFRTFTARPVTCVDARAGAFEMVARARENVAR